jgi:hypothetical protein
MNRSQRGVTIIEALGAVAIGSMMLLGLSAMIDSSMAELKGQQAAFYQSQAMNAARNYISANYTTLVAGTPTPATVFPVTIAQLKAGHFLPDSFAATNVYGQAACVLIRQPAPQKLDALIATSAGQPIPEMELRAVAANAGQGGGYISTSAPDVARGTSWSMNTAPYRDVPCGGGAPVLTGAAADGGHLVSSLFYDGPGQLSTDFLYRNAVPGRPELNQMNTPMRLAGGALVSTGAACGAAAAVAVDSATRNLLVCGTGGVWTGISQWKEPVATFGSLPGAGNVTGEVRMVTALSRAFTYNGTAWVPLAVDQNGDLQVPRHLVAQGDVDARGNITAELGMRANGDIRAAGNVSADADVTAGRHARVGRDLTVDGSVYVQGGVQALWMQAGAYQIQNISGPGDACNYLAYGPDGMPYIEFPTGTLVRDANGVVMNCALDSTFRYANGRYVR